MTLAETVRRSARQQNERHASDLVRSLTQARALEVETAQDVGKALQSATDSLTDLLRRTAEGQSQTESLLRQVQATADELRTAAGESTETQARKLAEVVQAMQATQAATGRQMAATLGQVGKAGEALKAARSEVTTLLAEVRGLVTTAQTAAEEAGRRRLLGPLVMVVITGLITSCLSAWLVSRMTGLPLRLPL